MGYALICKSAFLAVLIATIVFLNGAPKAAADGTVPFPSLNSQLFCSTAQTLNSAGAPRVSFALGSTMQIVFMLGLTGGSCLVFWAITVMQSNVVYSVVSGSCRISAVNILVTYSQLIPVDYAVGGWTVYVQVYAADGLTPLAVSTLIFYVT